MVVAVLLNVKALPTTDKRDPWRPANVLALEATQHAAEVGSAFLGLAVSLHKVLAAIRLVDDHSFRQVIAPPPSKRLIWQQHHPCMAFGLLALGLADELLLEIKRRIAPPVILPRQPQRIETNAHCAAFAHLVPCFGTGVVVQQLINHLWSRIVAVAL